MGSEDKRWKHIISLARHSPRYEPFGLWAGLIVDLADELECIACLRAENDAAWDALAALGDYLTPEQISAELARKGIDTSRAIERVRAALRARKGAQPDGR